MREQEQDAAAGAAVAAGVGCSSRSRIQQQEQQPLARPRERRVASGARGACGSPKMLRQQHRLSREPSPTGPACRHPLRAGGEARREVWSSLNRGRKLCFFVASPDCSRGPAPETLMGRSSSLRVPSSVGYLSFCIFYTSIYFFCLAL